MNSLRNLTGNLNHITGKIIQWTGNAMVRTGNPGIEYQVLQIGFGEVPIIDGKRTWYCRFKRSESANNCHSTNAMNGNTELKVTSDNSTPLDTQGPKADLRAKFNFSCTTSKSRRSVKVVLGTLEWQLSGQIDYDNVWVMSRLRQGSYCQNVTTTDGSRGC